MNKKEYLLSLLYPRRCPVCHEIAAPRRSLVCPACEKKVSFVKEPTCLRCGKEIAAREIEYCYDCSRRERSFTQGFALAIYDETMRQSIRQFKNGGRIEYADWYAAALWERYQQPLRQLAADGMAPVPLHRSRLSRRGYNQAEVLARRLSRLSGIPVWPKALVRPRKTVAQKYLGARERSQNLEGAFAAGRQSVAGRTVLLVDDIYTTGGTAEACTRVLLRAGARQVAVINVCIGENDG